jgi:hypothetical protein
MKRLVGGTRSPRRVSPNVEEVASAECPIGPGSPRPSKRSGGGEPGTKLGHEVLVVSALGVLSIFGCAKDEPKSNGNELSKANAAIKALAEADTEVVAECQRAADACNAKVPDGKAVDVCERLAARCDALNERLAAGRGPAVGCWNAVEACTEHAPERAQCLSDPTVCEALAEDLAKQRDKALACEARVQSCLTRTEDLPEAALVSCENIAAACEHAAAAGNKGDAGSDDVDDDDDDDGEDRADGGPAGEQGESDDDDDAQGEDGSGAKPHPAHPVTPRGHSAPADAGVD